MSGSSHHCSFFVSFFRNCNQILFITDSKTNAYMQNWYLVLRHVRLWSLTDLPKGMHAYVLAHTHTHMHIVVTEVTASHSTFCYFRVVTMAYYGRNDITLGGFLERFCFRWVSEYFVWKSLKKEHFVWTINDTSLCVSCWVWNCLNRASSYSDRHLTVCTTLSLKWPTQDQFI